MVDFSKVSKIKQSIALTTTTLAFTVCFAVWTIFAIIGVQIKKDLNLSEFQFGLMIGLPVLSGSFVRLNLGILTDQIGGRIVMSISMVLSAIATWMLSTVHTYELILTAGLFLGLAGGTFTVGIAYLSKWYPKEKQGTALGIFGMGNIGAAVTKFGAPYIMVAFGWEMVAKVWAVALLVITIVFWLITTDEPELTERRAKNEKPKSTAMAMEPLKELRVWRFSLYYFFVFGAFVGLALWLPRYYVSVYDLDIKKAGLLAASFSVAASAFRAIGGYLSDRFGARAVMYLTFIVSILCLFILSYPSTDFVIHGIKGDMTLHIGLDFTWFTIIVFVLGLFMSFGKAAVYKHIPVYYPTNVGSVAGIVGLIGGLGGFVLPLAFGYLNTVTNIWTSCFMLLFVLVSIALVWMHVTVRIMEHQSHPELAKGKFLPELGDANN